MEKRSEIRELNHVYVRRYVGTSVRNYNDRADDITKVSRDVPLFGSRNQTLLNGSRSRTAMIIMFVESRLCAPVISSIWSKPAINSEYLLHIVAITRDGTVTSGRGLASRVTCFVFIVNNRRFTETRLAHMIISDVRR